MNNEIFTRFLNGTASEAEQRTCEVILGGTDSIIDDSLIDHDDPMIQSLRRSTSPDTDSNSPAELPQQLQQMFPDNAERFKRMRQVLLPSQHPEDLGTIGTYRIIELIGVGSSSWVFRAFDSKLERDVCIKLLQPDRGSSWEVQSRFAREAREVARMSSDRIMPVLELGYLDQNPYLVMPLLEGRSLRTLLEQEQKIPIERAVNFARQIAEGLAHAHSLGVMHRDIKPENIWVTPSECIKLLDFGLAHVRDEATPITREGTVIGTPSYMSPEQVTGRPIDARSDLFSLGIVIVEMLTGQSPFNKKNLFSTMMSVAGDEIDFAAVDPTDLIQTSMRTVIVDLLHKNPDDRIASAEKLIERLDNLDSNQVQQRKHSGVGAAKLVAAGLAGFAICAALFALWMIGDKGTLIVEAVDPETQVTIAKEEVTVYDSVSQRRYEIKIGETKLPSGHYQLESEPAEGIVFSSNEITIRRAEKVLVVVHLKPSEKAAKSVTDSANALADRADEIRRSGGIESELQKPWADSTRDPLAHNPETRKQVFDRLAALPGQPFKRSAAVSHPQLAGVKDWWIDAPSSVLSIDSMPNCDQTFWMENRIGWVKISNRTGEKQLHIPTEGIIAFEKSIASWDPVNPNLLVTMSSNTIRSDSTDSKKRPFKAQVWLLSELSDCIQGRLIREYTCSSPNLMLDSGYRITLVRDDQLEIHRLENDQVKVISNVESHPDIFVPFYGGSNSISPNGRWLAARISPLAQKSIFDLHTGRMELAVDSSDRIFLGNGGVGVTVRKESLIDSPYRTERPLNQTGSTALETRESIKVWDIARQTMEREFSLGRLNVDRFACVAANPDATRLAFPTDSSIRIIDLKNGKQTIWSPAWNGPVAGPVVYPSIQSPNPNTWQSSKMGSSLQLDWQDDSTLIAFHRGERATWNVDTENKQGTQVVIPKHDPLIGRADIAGLQLHGDNELSIAWQAASGFRDRVSAVRVSLPGAKIVSELKLDGAYCVGTWQKVRRAKQLDLFSPNGRYLLVQNHPHATERGNIITLISVAQPDAVIANFDSQSFQKFSWTKDSKFLYSDSKVFDIENGKYLSRKPNSKESTSLGNYVELKVQQGSVLFYLSIETGNGLSINNQLEEAVGFRPRRIAIASEESSVPLILVKGNDDSVDSEVVLVRVRRDSPIELIGSGPFLINNNPTLYKSMDLVSPNVSHLLREPHPTNTPNPTMLPWQIHRINSKSEGKLEIAKVHELQGSPEAFRWHPQGTSASWASRNDKRLHFFDCATDTAYATELRSDLVIPFFGGWLLAIEDWLLAVDKTGNPNGRLLFDWDNGQPKNAHWVLPDNTVQAEGSIESLHGLYMSWVDQDTVRTLPLDRAIDSSLFRKSASEILSDKPLSFLE